MSAQELLDNAQKMRDTHMLLIEVTNRLGDIEEGQAGVVTPASLVPAIKTLADVVRGLAEDIRDLKHKEISGRMAKGGFDSGNA